MPQSVRDAAANYLPEGKTLQNQEDIVDYIFGFDVIAETKKVLNKANADADAGAGMSAGMSTGTSAVVHVVAPPAGWEARKPELKAGC